MTDFVGIFNRNSFYDKIQYQENHPWRKKLHLVLSPFLQLIESEQLEGNRVNWDLFTMEVEKYFVKHTASG